MVHISLPHPNDFILPITFVVLNLFDDYQAKRAICPEYCGIDHEHIGVIDEAKTTQSNSKEQSRFNRKLID